VRHYTTPRIKNCLRVSVGTLSQDDVLLAALREV
jgi:histidinol-phosphate/aromatic aminotransferase/cobyric acid decarboxylase-like protein